ncbi:MAG: undecaprenyl-phosphate glucose phosphotransferase [Lachnospiraceae bacterium]|nr:undecaprenyl-phosphate glucose phosphotransferase [Candidatus Colinaster scatohippi]
MIKDNQKYFNRLHILLDAIIVAASYMLAWWIKFEGPLADTSAGAYTMELYFSALYFLVPGYLILFYFNRMYTPKRTQRIETVITQIFGANVMGAIAFLVCIALFKIKDFSRGLIGIFFIINVILIILERLIVRSALRHFRSRGYNVKHVLLVGYSRAAEEYINRIIANPQWGYVIRGILDDTVPRGTMYKGAKVIGGIDNLNMILPVSELDEIAVTLSLADYNRLEELVGLCEKSGVHTKFIPDYNSLIPNRPYTEDLNGLPVINIRYVPLSNTINAICKRIVDIIGSFVGIVVLSPLLIIVALIVKFSSKGPIIFKQQRVGLHNKNFNMYKFRTMCVQDKETEAKGWTTKDDPRVTKVGKFLRKTSIDELPQLFNILKGDMSIVGPRPERPQFVEKFKEEIPRYMIKHQVRPGLTGWAQINGYRGDTSIRKRIDYDIYYIENWSMAFDIKIMFLTVFRGLMNENAY